jgi:hypothetical protein
MTSRAISLDNRGRVYVRSTDMRDVLRDVLRLLLEPSLSEDTLAELAELRDDCRDALSA